LILFRQLTAERPDTMVAVICGAIYRADQILQHRTDDFKKQLQKGQHPGPELLRTDSSVEIIYENVKYSFT